MEGGPLGFTNLSLDPMLARAVCRRHSKDHRCRESTCEFLQILDVLVAFVILVVRESGSHFLTSRMMVSTLKASRSLSAFGAIRSRLKIIDPVKRLVR